jgi:hypothetical protein
MEIVHRQDRGKRQAVFCFGADGDSSDPETGIYGWVSSGSECSAELVQLVGKFAA